MKVSIITVVYNNVTTIEDTILSVASQTHPNFEHIIVDGVATDGTLAIIKKHHDKITTTISEPDHGIYDAMNKGIKLASGDVVGMLNSDDIYFDSSVISTVVNQFKTKKVDSVFADLVYVNGDNLQKVVRYYRSAGFEPGRFAYGFMPAHPTFFTRREVYEKYGLFKTNYKIASEHNG